MLEYVRLKLSSRVFKGGIQRSLVLMEIPHTLTFSLLLGDFSSSREPNASLGTERGRSDGVPRLQADAIKMKALAGSPCCYLVLSMVGTHLKGWSFNLGPES